MRPTQLGFYSRKGTGFHFCSWEPNPIVGFHLQQPHCSKYINLWEKKTGIPLSPERMFPAEQSWRNWERPSSSRCQLPTSGWLQGIHLVTYAFLCLFLCLSLRLILLFMCNLNTCMIVLSTAHLFNSRTVSWIRGHASAGWTSDSCFGEWVESICDGRRDRKSVV